MPRRVIGVDFSGAEDAGRRLWVAAGAIVRRRLRIDRCLPGEALAGSGRGRADCLEALRAFIAQQGACAVGVDVPFSLPVSLMGGQTWEAFVLSFARRYPSALAFRAACWSAAGGAELKRLTDREARTPFCAYNLRLYRQTYFALRDLLGPLVRDGAACVLPMQPRRVGVPWLLEICPASTLKQAALYRPYKGRGELLRTRRAEILDSLLATMPIDLGSEARSTAIANEGGDALDSVIAAAAAFRALQDPARLACPSSLAALEGYVYV